MRARPHFHPCGHCGVKTECCGEIEQNYDGDPPFICREFHVLVGQIFQPGEFLCDECAWKRQQSECDDCGVWGDEPHKAECSA